MSDESVPSPPPPTPAPPPFAPPPQANWPCPPRRRRYGGWIVLLALVLAASLLANAWLLRRERLRFGPPPPRGAELSEETVQGSPFEEAKVALIPVTGLIHSGGAGMGGSGADAIVRQLARATDDPGVRAILLRIDTPGGEAAAADLIHNAVERARDKKKVIAWLGSMATSGGYYVAAAADEIIAAPLSSTGSVGVILVMMNYRGLLEKVGVTPYVFARGDNKDLYSGLREDLNDEDLQRIDEYVGVAYDRFVTVVAEGRGIPEETVRNDIADGRIIPAAEALSLQLVNRLGYFDDAVERVRKLAGAADARVIRYERPFSVRDLLRANARPPALRVELAPTELRLTPGLPYLLPEGIVRAALATAP